jgi:DNA-directed RNA polymerase specialized sigma24 family protein
VDPVATATDEPERVVDGWTAPVAEGPEGSYLREQVLVAVTRALESLPPEQRDVFVAHEFEGKSFKVLAAETGTPVNTLLGRKHAAVTALRRRLDSYQWFLDQLEDT